MTTRFANVGRLLGALLAGLLVSACGETADERNLRQTQFNGKPLEHVIGVIGAPKSRSKTEATWSYFNAKNQRVPIQSFQNGKFVTIGYRTESLSTYCTYTAKLQSDHISESRYVGNNCYPYAPQLPSQN